jgi:hypothetical protein
MASPEIGFERNRWAVAAVVITVAVLVTHSLPVDDTLSVAARLVPASLAVAFVPGLLVSLLAGARSELSPLRLIAVALAVSFPVIQLLTIASLLLHLRVDFVLWALLAVNLLLAGWLLKQERSGKGTTRLTAYEYALAAGIIVIAARLFQHGSPVDTWEDSIHIGVIRRLIALPAPNLQDMYIVGREEPDFRRV